MREAMGGSWLIGIVMLFIVLFASFLAISINYSRAFSTKNEILSMIEKNEGFSVTPDPTPSCTDDSTQCNIQRYLKKVGYNISDNIKCPEIYDDYAGNPMYTQPGGYCVKKTCTSGGTYYTVTTYVRVELPIIFSALNIPVTGQTMSIYYINNNDGLECS